MPTTITNQDFKRFDNFANKRNYASLYLFTPKRIPDQVVRPYVYEFDTNFTDHLRETLDDTVKAANSSHAGSSRQHLQEFMNSYDSNRVITPQAEGIPIMTNTVSDFYTFMLAINNVSFSGANRKADMENKFIYTGFCLGEPAIMSNGNVVFNNNCVLTPTHLTTLNVKRHFTSQGEYYKVTPGLDIDLVQPELSQQLNGYVTSTGYVDQRIMINTPEYIAGTLSSYTPMDFYESNMLVTNDNAANIFNHTAPIRISNIKNTPKQQLSSVVDSLAQFHINNSYDTGLAPSLMKYEPSPYDAEFSVNGIASHLAANMNVGYTEIMPNALNINKPILMVDLLRLYPSIKDNTELFEMDSSAMGANPGAAPNPINIASTLIGSNIPALFNSAGLSYVAFRYTSTNSSAIIKIDDQPVYKLLDLAAFLPEDRDTTVRRWYAILPHIQKELFQMVLQMFGHFDVNVVYRSGGECIVNLQLLDINSGISNDDFTVNSCILGGINTSAVSNKTGFENNTVQLQGALVETIPVSNFPSYKHI